MSLPKINFKKAESCEDKKECCDEKEACCSANSKLLDRAKRLISKKAECTGKEDCPVCNKAKKLAGKAAESAQQITGKASAVVEDGAKKAKEAVSKLRERTNKVIGKVKMYPGLFQRTQETLCLNSGTASFFMVTRMGHRTGLTVPDYANASRKMSK